MLPEQDRELLTAYVDGELSARQRKAVLRLLRRSGEARELLRRLQDDARELSQLPRPQLAPGFSDRVLQNINQRGLRPPRRPDRAAVPLWTVVTAAASVLFAVGLATFALFVTTMAEDTHPSRVTHQNKPDNKTPSGIGKDIPPPPGKEGIARGRPEEGPSKGRTEVKDGTGPEPVVKNPNKGTGPDGREKPEEDPPGAIRTDRFVERLNPDEVDVWVPSLFRLRELSADAERKKVQKDLARDNGFCIELLCREGTHAFPRLQAALKAGGVELIVDQVAQFRLKNPKLKTNYLLYLEDLTPEEVGKVLERLGGPDDTRFDEKKPTLGQFAGSDFNVVLFRMTPEHRKILSQHLGVDLRQASGTKGPLGVDLHRPLAEQTADQVVGALATGAARPSSRSSASKEDRLGLALAYGLARPQSAEVKRFLDSRKPPRKGTLQVLLILRTKP